MGKEATKSKFYIQVILIVGAMIGIRFVPPIGQITPYGMQVLGIFVGCIIGWGFGHHYFASVLALIFLSFCSENTLSGVFASAFGNSSALMVLFSFIFCFGIEQTGIMKFIATWILGRKFATKGPWFISLAFWIAVAVCSALITNCLPVIILLWSMFYAIVENAGIDRKNKWVQITMIMMCVIGYTGSVTMPYAVWNLVVLGIASNAVGDVGVNLLAHCSLMISLNILIIATVFVMCKFVFGRTITEIKITKIVDVENLKATKQQKWGAFYLVVLAVILFLPNVLSKTAPGMAILSALTNTGGFAVVTLLMCITYIDDEPLININEAIRNVQWSVMFLLYAALYIASLLDSSAVGIGATVSGALNSAIGGLGIFGITALFIFFGCLLTNAINNVVCVNIIVPIGVAMIIGLEGDPAVFASLMCPILYLGLMFPSGSVVGALMHGNKDWLKPSTIYKYAFIGCMVVVFWGIVVGIPLGNLFYSIFA